MKEEAEGEEATKRRSDEGNDQRTNGLTTDNWQLTTNN
jgi:hypothetical protein